MSPKHTLLGSASRQVVLGVAVALLAFAGWAAAQHPASPTARERDLYRASLTATLIYAGRAVDSAGTRCRLISIEWRPIAGASSYQVQVSVGTPGIWVAVRPDPRCGAGGPSAPTAFRDRVARPEPHRLYRVVALAADGRGLLATEPVPVDVR